MSTLTIFISAATVDLFEWRGIISGAFRRAGFNVFVQNESLKPALGNVRQKLVEHITDSDCVVHLAGLGYGTHADAPFPESPNFQCSWTQFEYYYSHHLGKDVIAFVCAPSLSAPNFLEKGSTKEKELKKEAQRQHRERVESGRFDKTPLEGLAARTSNEPVDSQASLLKAVAGAVSALNRTDPAYGRARFELHAMVGKLDQLSAQMEAHHAAQREAQATMFAGLEALRRELSALRAEVIRSAPASQPR